MPVAFDTVPQNALVPLFWPEVRPAQAPFQSQLKLLLIGRAEHVATGPENYPLFISDVTAAAQWGPGSMIAHMYETARLNGGPFLEIWAMAMPKDNAFIPATARLKVQGPARFDSSIALLIGGRTLRAVVRKGQTADTIALNLKSQVNRQPGLSFVAAIDSVHSNWVNLTCKWRGMSGNRIMIVSDYYRVANDAGYLLDISQPDGGVGEPSISAAFDAIHGREFDCIVPADYCFQPKLDNYRDEMDGVTGRWSPGQQLYGHIFVGHKMSSLTDSLTLADANNDPHVTVIPALYSPTPMWEWASAWAAHAAFHLAAPPEISRPLQTIILKNLLVPKNMDNWFDLTEQQALLEYGLCAWAVGPGNQPMIMRSVTLRKDNAWGSPDPSWRDTETMFQAMYFTRFMKAWLTGLFPRAAFTTQPINIPGFTSPLQIRMALLQAYLFLQRQGLVENYELFAAALVVEKSAIDPNRCDVYMRPDLVNQLRVVAAAIETNLELTAAGNAISRAEAA